MVPANHPCQEICDLNESLAYDYDGWRCAQIYLRKFVKRGSSLAPTVFRRTARREPLGIRQLFKRNDLRFERIPCLRLGWMGLRRGAEKLPLAEIEDAYW